MNRDTLQQMTVANLKKMCSEKGIKAQGPKNDLICRILWSHNIPLVPPIVEESKSLSFDSNVYKYIIPVLYIIPRQPKSEESVNDELTMCMKEAFEEGKIGSLNYNDGNFSVNLQTLGHHTCVCGATSTGYDVLIHERYATNYLCEHYLMWHRQEVPESELNKVRNILALQREQ
jgi:hypothetical protein